MKTHMVHTQHRYTLYVCTLWRKRIWRPGEGEEERKNEEWVERILLL